MPPHRMLMVLACVVAAAAFAGFRVLAGDSTERNAASAGTAKHAPRAVSRAERQLATALRAGVARAALLDGTVEAAVMTDESQDPIVAASPGGAARRQMRMWSMSKVATMITLLRALRWGDRPGEATSAEVDSALRGAIVGSENCRQRRVVLELQRQTGGVTRTRQALTETFALAGSRPRISGKVAAPEPHCVEFLRSQPGLADPQAPALLLGTSTWRVADAVRLAHALATNVYGGAISARVLRLMSAPKQPSRESSRGAFTAPLEWGAGDAFSGYDPAFKAGWGGSLNGNFFAGQLAVVPIGEGDRLAIAVMFHPDAQPVRDDPGITAAPSALQTVMESVRSIFSSP